MLRVALIAAALVAVLFGASSANARADTISASPTWATLTQVSGDNRQFTVTGCGFRTYSEVVCVWNNRWASVKSSIDSDTSISCEIPTPPPGEIETLPFYVPVKIIFDGDYDKAQNVLSQFRFGPTCTGVQPQQVATGGGQTVTISGQGFNEFSSATVYFDGVAASGTRSATAVTATIPSTVDGKYFNAYLMVNVMFNNNGHYQLHCTDTIHVGPVVTTVSPNCGLDVDGGTSITFSGTDMADPALGSGSPNVLVEFKYTGVTPQYKRVWGQRNGATVTVAAPKITGAGKWGATAVARIVFDWSYIRVAIPEFASTTVTYGPTYSSFSPSRGWLIPNGDRLTLQGCGFSNFTVANTAVKVSGADGDVDCTNIVIASDTTLTCTYGKRSKCIGSLRPVITFKSGVTPVQVSTSGTTYSATFAQGPTVDSLTTSTNGVPGFVDGKFQRGRKRGGDTITFAGTYMFRKQGGSTTAGEFFTPQCNWANDGTTPNKKANNNAYSDTSLSCVSPPGKWDFNTVVSIDFGSDCTVATSFDWHWGPLCWQIAPTYGPILGGAGLTLTGAGFQDNSSWTTDVYFCNIRIFGAAAAPTGQPFTTKCAKATTASPSSTSIAVTTPTFPASYNKTEINAKWSGIRLFGDLARLEVVFGKVTSQFIQCLGRNAALTTSTRISNGASTNRWDYRWGPIVTSVSPAKAEFGPRFGYQPVSVSVSGGGFSDGYVSNRVMVGFSHRGSGKKEGIIVAASTSGDSSISASTLWGGRTNEYQDVTVFFDTCNQTTVYADAGFTTPLKISWGPVISYLEYKQGTSVQKGVTTTIDKNCGDGKNTWGLKPWGGETISIIGAGFNEFKATGETLVVIDEVEMAATVASDTEITCKTPARDYWTNASVIVQFGKTTRASLSDWARWLPVKQNLLYRPCIESLSATVGFAKGGDAVSLKGYGLQFWNDPTLQGVNSTFWPKFSEAQAYICMFGNYKGTQTGTPTFSQVDCTTPASAKPSDTSVPSAGAQFNTDVYVSLQLYNAPLDKMGQRLAGGVVPFDWKVWAPTLFHYGPVCQTTDKPYARLTGDYDVTLNGLAFKDDVTISKWRVRLNGVNITGYKPITSGDITATTIKINNADWPASTTCYSKPTFAIDFELNYDKTLFIGTPPTLEHTIACPAGILTYGPQVSTTRGETFKNGWIASQITIKGLGFQDPTIWKTGDKSVSVLFGGNAAIKATTTGDTTITATAPGVGSPDNSLWVTTVPVTVAWNGADANVTCGAQNAGTFTYGAELCKISPNFGYIRGTATSTVGGTASSITVTGRGFQCDKCAFTKTECRWIINGIAINVTATGVSDTSATCTVPGNNKVQNVATLSMRFNNTDSRIIGTASTSGLCTSGTDLSYTYQPQITATTVYSRIAGATTVAITGQRFDDKFFTFRATNKVWVRLSGSSSNIYVDGTVASSSSITFNTILWGGKSCGDEDMAQPIWNMKQTGSTNAGCTGSCLCTGDDWCLAPATTIKYGNPRGVKDAGSATRFVTEGGGTVVVNVADYTPGPACGTIFGTGCAKAWDDYLDKNYATAKDGVSDNANQVVCRMGQFWSTGTAATTTSQATCPVPAGAFNYTAPDFAILLAPNTDYLTLLTKKWRWVPYSDRLSTPWGPAQEYHTVVAYGDGWMRYDNAKEGTVLCLFGGVEGVQSDLTDDYMITCRTPARSNGDSPVELRFCDHAAGQTAAGDPTTGENSCSCNYLGSPDATTSLASFTTVGVSNIAPASGPIQGNTEVTVSGSGFTFFSALTCNFGASSVPVASAGNTTSATPKCTTASRASPAIVPFSLSGTYQGKVYTFAGPTPFDFGRPQVLSITPNEAQIDQAQEFTLAGKIEGYFNGGSTYACRISGQGQTVTIDGTLDASSQVICNVPGGTLATIGSYIIEAVIDGAATSDNQRVEYKQTSTATSFTPTRGSFLGGEPLVVTGNGFNGALGNVVFCRFSAGNTHKVTGGAFTPGANGTTTSGNSTTTAARRSTSIEERRRPFAMSRRADSRGVGDKITCNTAPYDAQTSASVSISIDGGQSWASATGSFLYENVAPNTPPSPSSGSRFVAGLASLVVAAVIALAL